jgi:ATP-dependent helicase/nuclease subunit A
MSNLPIIPAQPDRDRILHDLDTNFMVEAGAGSGKTEALTQRMLRLIARHDGDLRKIVAITFTRKAASEMRQRIQEGLESAVRDHRWGYRSGPNEAPSEEVPAKDHPALKKALESLERLQVTTIHAFCTRLLMSTALPIGLHPGFRALEEEKGTELLQADFLEYLKSSAVDQERLDEIGCWPQAAAEMFTEYASRKDTDLKTVMDQPTELVLADAVKGLAALRILARESLGDLVDGKPDTFHDLLKSTEKWPNIPRPDLLGKILKDLISGLEGLEEHEDPKPANIGIGVRSYLNGKGKELFRKAMEVIEKHKLLPFLIDWRAWKHAHLLDLFDRALEAGFQKRLRKGLLTFQDLLRCALMALSQESALRRLRAEISSVLIDEFQDTDPLQLKLAFSLASQGAKVVDDWQKTRLRPGSIFLVGDPKQSIYRFRRADIHLYLQVREAAKTGKTDVKLLELSTNFRSDPALLQTINKHFSSAMQSGNWQAEYKPMTAGKIAAKESGVFHLPTVAWQQYDDAWEKDARRLAALIQGMKDQISMGEILILTWTTKSLPIYARIFEEAGIPTHVSGTKDLGERLEMAELARALWSLAFAGDQAALVGVLRGLWFGLDDGQIEEWVRRPRTEGVHTWQAPKEGDPGFNHPVGRALVEWSALRKSVQGLAATAIAEKLVLGEGLAIQAALAPDEQELRIGALAKQLESWKSRESAGERLSLAILAKELRDLALHTDENEGVSKGEGAVARPGALDAVRIMNLHKAKGLEAEVVILAEPVISSKTMGRPVSDLVRREAGESLLYFVPTGIGGYLDYVPRSWSQVLPEAKAALDAERLRLRYVAATRAKRMLIISQAEVKINKDGSPSKIHVAPWASLLGMAEPWKGHIPDLQSAPTMLEEKARKTLELELKELEKARQLWNHPSWSVRNPSKLKSGTADKQVQVVKIERIPGAEAPEAMASQFGDAFHALMELVVRCLPKEYTLTELAKLADWQTEENDLPASSAKALCLRVQSVLNSDFWKRLKAAQIRLVEFPIREIQPGEVLQVTEARVDLMFEEAGAWVLADWKSGTGTPEKLETRQGQLQEYARLIETSIGRTTDCLILKV